MQHTDVLSLLVIVASVFSVTNCSIPSFLKICFRNDPELGKCVTNSVYHLLPLLKVGIPEYGIPSIEPFYLTDINLNTGSQSTTIRSNLSDIKAWHGSSFKIQEVIPNVPKNKYRFKVVIPRLYLEGHYEIDTKILFLQLKGNGPLNINVTNVNVDCILKGNKVKKEDVHHLLFEKMKCQIAFNKAYIKLENLFGSNPTLSKATNDVINDNLDLFFQEIRPNLLEAIATTFTDIANKITNNFDYDEVFPIK